MPLGKSQPFGIRGLANSFKALAHRPDREELEERNILHTRAEISERQQGSQISVQIMGWTNIDLELAKAMAQRPERDDLVQRTFNATNYSISLTNKGLRRGPSGNILPHNANVAPALVAHQRELEKNMLERDLKVFLPLHHRRSLSPHLLTICRRSFHTVQSLKRLSKRAY